MHDGDQMNGHPLRVLRTQLDLSQKDFATKVGVSEVTISRAENGYCLSPKVRHQLCDRLGMTSEALGLLGRKQEVIHPSSTLPPAQEHDPPPFAQTISSLTGPVQPQSRPTILVNDTQPVALAKQSTNASPSIEEHQQEQAWLTLGAHSLGQLFASGWSIDEILEALKVVLQGVQGVPIALRQQLLKSNLYMRENNVASVGSRISEEEQAKLHSAFGASVASAWHLFLSASSTQILSLGQIQLALLQRVHPLLHPYARPFLYAGIYGLIGISLHFQERDEEALQAHYNAYMAALATNDSWYIAQSLICQADCHNALGRYDIAIQLIKEALEIIGTPLNEADVATTAHLLTCWADNAMMLEDYKTAQEKLETSQAYLDHIKPNLEFDKTGWLLLAGKYALRTNNYQAAIQHFEDALVTLPEQWTFRRAMTALGLTKAYAHIKERGKSLALAEELVPLVKTVDARILNRWLTEYLQQDLLTVFPTDGHVRGFVTGVYQHLPQLTSISRGF